MKKLFFLILLISLFCTIPALGENDGDCIYTLLDENGAVLTRRGGRMYVGDEYISCDNRSYKIVSVDDAAAFAVAVPTVESDSAAALSSARAEKSESSGSSDGKRLICMYSTHSDESYVPDDGDFSLWENAGIYDVGHALKDELEDLGVTVIYSEESHLPHDADAYNRSRSTAAELLKKQPDALLDIHRDAIPAEEYETTVEGEDISMVRLFVGRSNQNSAANKAFARQIKKVADEQYPGLIKDIYIGKGNYNQELYPRALLLEFGTDKIEKEKAIGATKYLAKVMEEVLYGGPAAAAEQSEEKASFSGIAWIIGIAAVAAVVFALASTGKLSGLWTKLRRGTSEMTGGLFGKKPDDR